MNDELPTLFTVLAKVNPDFYDWTLVHVLYCSGDVHVGNSTRDYTDPNGGSVVQVTPIKNSTMTLLQRRSSAFSCFVCVVFLNFVLTPWLTRGHLFCGVWWQVGALNAIAVLDWVTQQGLGELDQLLIAGCSAGSVGAQVSTKKGERERLLYL